MKQINLAKQLWQFLPPFLLVIRHFLLSKQTGINLLGELPEISRITEYVWLNSHLDSYFSICIAWFLLSEIFTLNGFTFYLTVIFLSEFEFLYENQCWT